MVPFHNDAVDAFVRVVRAAFGHRRKTLFNAMRDAGFSSVQIGTAFLQAKIDGTRRAETLTIQEFENVVSFLFLGLTSGGS